jgi:hypothetical protein
MALSHPISLSPAHRCGRPAVPAMRGRRGSSRKGIDHRTLPQADQGVRIGGREGVSHPNVYRTPISQPIDAPVAGSRAGWPVLHRAQPRPFPAAGTLGGVRLVDRAMRSDCVCVLLRCCGGGSGPPRDFLSCERRPATGFAARVVLAGLLGLTVASCGAASRPRARPSSSAKLPAARAVSMARTPAAAFAICREITLMSAVCPRRVPVGRYSQPHRPPGYRGVYGADAIAGCFDQNGSAAAITSRACSVAYWSLDAGGPAGIPADAPPGTPGKRISGAWRTRPPGYVHVLIYASPDPIRRNAVPFAWPQGRPQPVANALLNANRKQPISLGWVRWAGHYGQLVLAPPLAFGGMAGDHVIFRFNVRGINYAVTLHSWAPLRRAVATLHVVVASAA